MKSKKTYLLALLAIVSVSASTSFTSASNQDNIDGQNGIVITGTVTNKKGKAIKGAPVEVLNTDRYTLTDDKGYYQIEGLPDSKLRFSYLGYNSDTINIKKSENINVKLYTEDDLKPTKKSKNFKGGWTVGGGVGGSISL